MYYPFLDLYSLYKPSSLIYIIYIFQYTNTQFFLHGIGVGSLIFYSLPLLSQSRHYSHRIAHFSDEHHCLPFISYLCKPKIVVTGHSEVDLVETITPVCSR